MIIGKIIICKVFNNYSDINSYHYNDNIKAGAKLAKIKRKFGLSLL